MSRTRFFLHILDERLSLWSNQKDEIIPLLMSSTNHESRSAWNLNKLKKKSEKADEKNNLFKLKKKKREKAKEKMMSFSEGNPKNNVTRRVKGFGSNHTTLRIDLFLFPGQHTLPNGWNRARKWNVWMLHLQAADSQYKNHPESVCGIPWERFGNAGVRLRTFKDYPSSSVKSSDQLSHAGFVYIGDGFTDEVICAYCCVTKKDWKPDEDVGTVHRILNPWCSMVKSTKTSTPSVSTLSNGAVQHLSSLPPPVSSFETMSINGHMSPDSPTASSIPSPTFDSMDTDVNEGNVCRGDLTDASARVPDRYGDPQSSQGVLDRGLEESQGARRKTTVHATSTTKTSKPKHNFRDDQNERNDEIRQRLVHDVDVSTENEENPETEAMGQNQVIPQSFGSNEESRRPMHSATPLEGAATTLADSFRSTHRPPEQSAIAGQTPRPLNSHQVDTSSTPVLNDQIFSFTANTPAVPEKRDNPMVSLQELGIYHERVKSQQMAISTDRKASFETWPKDMTFFNIDEAVQAGLFYMGYGDATQCFHCAGRLNRWRNGDDPFIEHTRLYPRCPYIRQKMGQQFVEAVLSRQQSGKYPIEFESVCKELAQRGILVGQDLIVALRQDPAVKAMMDLNFDKDVVLRAATRLYDAGTTLNAPDLYKELSRDLDLEELSSSKEDQENIKELTNKTQDLRRIMMCKVCMERNVKMIFLPCGHLTTCQECAPAMKECPLCRGVIRASVIANFQT